MAKTRRKNLHRPVSEGKARNPTCPKAGERNENLVPSKLLFCQLIYCCFSRTFFRDDDLSDISSDDEPEPEAPLFSSPHRIVHPPRTNTIVTKAQVHVSACSRESASSVAGERSSPKANTPRKDKSGGSRHGTPRKNLSASPPSPGRISLNQTPTKASGSKGKDRSASKTSLIDEPSSSRGKERSASRNSLGKERSASRNSLGKERSASRNSLNNVLPTRSPSKKTPSPITNVGKGAMAAATGDGKPTTSAKVSSTSKVRAFSQVPEYY